ncbi:MAG: carbohydrate binding domain-containing protein [Candidatus Methanoperedens sp.]
MQIVEVLKDQTIQVTGTYEASGNLVINPGFESWTTPWIFYTNGNGKFTASPPSYEGNNSANVVLYTGGTNIQLYQKGISLEPKTRYRLSFAAYSSTGHDLNVKLIKHVSPYTGYGLDQTFNLSASWQEFSTEFITTGFTGSINNGRLMFYLAPFAKAGDKYYIDNVRLEKI